MQVQNYMELYERGSVVQLQTEKRYTCKHRSEIVLEVKDAEIDREK